MDLGKLAELGSHRVCQVCGAEFYTIPAQKGEPEIPALVQFSDHITEHQPTGAQWTEAYNKIQRGKESARGNT
jgi:hypothetical protein